MFDEYGNPVTFKSPGRQVNADGTITIMCKICEKPISRQMYRGFSTAYCAVCYGSLEKGMSPQDVLLQTKQREEKERIALYNEIGPGNFKAAGIGQRMKEVIEKIKVTAQGRRRKPLFAKKD